MSQKQETRGMKWATPGFIFKNIYERLPPFHGNINMSDGLMGKALDSQSRGPVLKVDSAFHPSKVDKVSTRNFWGLIGKK